MQYQEQAKLNSEWVKKTAAGGNLLLLDRCISAYYACMRCGIKITRTARTSERDELFSLLSYFIKTLSGYAAAWLATHREVRTISVVWSSLYIHACITESYTISIWCIDVILVALVLWISTSIIIAFDFALINVWKLPGKIARNHVETSLNLLRKYSI